MGYNLDQLKKIIESELKQTEPESNVVHLVDNTLADEGDVPSSKTEAAIVYIPLPLQDASYVKMELLKVCLADFKEQYPLTQWQMMNYTEQSKAITKVFESAQHLIDRFKELHYPT